jgi:LuxR family maltose regulon positive regulatory protein
VAWVSLEQQDNDPVRFWDYVLAALRLLPISSQSPGVLRQGFLAALRSTLASVADLSPSLPRPESERLESTLGGLINEILALPSDAVTGSPLPFVLALDDYHVIESRTIHDAMAFLLEHLPA